MTTNGIEEIEHTADWAIRVRAQDLGTLFERSALGMFELVGRADTEKAEIVRPFTLQASDLETLLVGWLEELLFILETEDLFLSRCSIQIPSKNQLLATIGLRPVQDRWKEIKAVTYHNLEIHQSSEGYEVSIVFDV
jgi:SHS2 domain-containing protein